MRFYTYIILLGILVTSAQAEVKIRAFFEPARIKSNQTSTYVIRIEESDTKAMPRLEPINDLQLQEEMGGLRFSDGNIRQGPSQRYNINGAKTFMNSFDVTVRTTPSDVGSYTIPAHQFTYKGKKYTAPAATLTVVERTAQNHPEEDETVRLLVETPEKLYVGQTTNITVKLHIYDRLENIQNSGLNQSAPGFILKVDENSIYNSTEYLEGWAYRVVNWPVEITPIKTGELALNFEVIVSQITGFGFFSRNQERFSIYSEPATINVLPLPETNKPESFTGAIGDFTTEVFADQEKAVEGEPIMLSLTVRGTGNFERITGPEFPESAEWRSYSPESFFEPNEARPLSGSKRFDYVFIPQTSGELKLPEVAFTYFDTKSEKYVELTSPQIPVEVTATARSAPFIPNSANTQGEQKVLDLKRTLTGEEALLMLDYQPKRARTGEPTILQHPLFYTGNAIAFIALIAGSIVSLRHRKLLNDADYVRVKEAGKELKRCLKNLESPAAKNKSTEFYKEAQRAIRLAATKRTGKDLVTATASDLEAYFIESNVPTEISDASKAIFENANTALFSNQGTQTDLQKERASVNKIIKAL